MTRRADRYGISIPHAPRHGGSIYANHNAVAAEADIYWNSQQAHGGGGSSRSGGADRRPESAIYGLQQPPPADELYGIANNVSAETGSSSSNGGGVGVGKEKGSGAHEVYWNYKPELNHTRPSQRAVSSVKQRTVVTLASIPSDAVATAAAGGCGRRGSGGGWVGGHALRRSSVSSVGSASSSAATANALRRNSVSSQGVASSSGSSKWWQQWWRQHGCTAVEKLPCSQRNSTP